jgi:hypothetical protein
VPSGLQRRSPVLAGVSAAHERFGEAEAFGRGVGRSTGIREGVQPLLELPQLLAKSTGVGPPQFVEAVGEPLQPGYFSTSATSVFWT